MKQNWNKFWTWYERHFVKSFVITGIIIFVQYPHMLWNADLYFELGIGIAHQHPILDFVLYGVDPLEIILSLDWFMKVYTAIRIRNAKRH